MPLAFNSFAFSMSSVNRELPPSMTRSPLSSSSAELGDGLAGSAAPAGTITQTVRGASSALTSVGQRRDVGDVGVAVEADDLVAGAAQPLAHVAAHLARDR